MLPLKKLGIMAGVALFALFFVVPRTPADVSNQATEITFANPVRVPGQVLPAGTYWFTVLDTNTGLMNVIQIFNADHSKVVAQLNTQVTDKTGGYGQEVTMNGVRWPTGKLVLTVADTGNQQPAALLDWYYPGRTDGHRFVYSTQRQTQLDEEQHETIAINAGDVVTLGTSPAAFE